MLVNSIGPFNKHSVVSNTFIYFDIYFEIINSTRTNYILINYFKFLNDFSAMKKNQQQLLS